MFSKSIDIAKSSEMGLRQLASVAGGDLATFYVGADLRGVDLRGQDLRGINFRNADFRGAIVDQDTLLDHDFSFGEIYDFGDGESLDLNPKFKEAMFPQEEEGYGDPVFQVTGGRPLHGSVPISGSKNGALVMIASSLLTDKPVLLSNVPSNADVRSMVSVAKHLGVRCEFSKGNLLFLAAGGANGVEVPYEFARKMRASTLFLGPILARHGDARVSLPGGCAIGTRPIDLHLKGLAALGADIDLVGGYVEARAKNGLKGANITFPSVSVGATQTVLMAACLAQGETTIINAAREPEIVDLAKLLVGMGAKIEGAGTDKISVVGVDDLQGTGFRVAPDRIEAGTLALAVGIAGGVVELLGVSLSHLEGFADVLATCGLDIEPSKGGVRVTREPGTSLLATDIMTEPYPGFPTDLQAQFTAMMCITPGASMVTETVFENRFMHCTELVRMGANINIHGRTAIVRGVRHLDGAETIATDLRASASLVIAGLAAHGTTTVGRTYHLDRGYDRLPGKLRLLGADVKVIYR